MPGETTSRYRVRLAADAADLRAAQALRHRAFMGGTVGRGVGDPLDRDAYDPICRHLLVEPRAGGPPVATFRVLTLADGGEIGRSYASQFYALDGLRAYPAPMLEMGRFCIRPGETDPDILRVAWAELTRIVDQTGARMLFGCSSFRGCETGIYGNAFAMLRDRHLAPEPWRPREKAKDIFRFARRLRRKPDRARALKEMPPLLRGYLAMGGWVSDHAVIDRDLGTLHVFTGLEVDRIPPERVRALRRAAA